MNHRDLLPEIEFYVGGKRQTMRHTWTVVPNVGDEVDFHDGSTVKVRERRFGDYGPNSMDAGRQIVHLHCAWVTPPKRGGK